MIRILIIAMGCMLIVACQSNLSQGPKATEDLASVFQLFVPEDSLAAANALPNPTFGLVSNGNYIGALSDLIVGQDKLLAKYPPSMYYQSLGTALSKVGEYQTVFEAWSLQMESESGEELNRDSVALLIQSMSLVDAKEEILAAASEQQVIMINEAHHLATHRVFTSSLLAGLYQNGFRYLAAETLSHSDIERLNQSKIPGFKSGVYISEPQYANLLRQALALGYTLVAYENKGNLSGSQRDSVQARNLANVIEKDPAAKMLVHAGYAHIYEKTNSPWVKMGQYFQAFTGINPLTINQTELTEKGNAKFENPYYETILDAQKPKVASVLMQENRYWTLPQFESFVDIQMIHPRTTWHHERAHWLQTKDFQSLKIPQAKLEDAMLIQAFSAAETKVSDANQLIPLDQILVKNRDRDKYLFVPRNQRYLIRILDRNNEVLHQYRID